MSFDLTAPLILKTAICALVVSTALLFSLAVARRYGLATHHRRANMILSGPMQPISLRRPRWENLLLVASVAIFWAGVILKIMG